MQQKLIKYGKMSLWISLLGLAGVIFLPKTYHFPPKIMRASTQFWDLSTGSKIGYTYLPAASTVPKKPFPIIVLHGGPGGKMDDGTILRAGELANAGFDVYLYDQIGSGQSARLNF
jgi:proline iminopeptidase